MRNKIIEIFFVKKGAFNQSEYFKLEILENKNILKYSINEKSNIFEIDNSKIDVFLDRLIRTIANWENRYVNENVVDGSIWQLKIIFKNNIKWNYSGRNSYPLNFENFIILKNKLLI